VFFGPASTLFGSDALGGAVTMNTKKSKVFK
jgi:hemoglobin/transferrin/lactoferrin receptor protein